MLFNSLLFIVFFTVTAILYWLLPGRFRPVLLLTASLIFYGVYIPEYLLVLLLAVLMNFYFGKAINAAEDKKRTRLLVWGIISNVALLALFKYANPLLNALVQTRHASSQTMGPSSLHDFFGQFLDVQTMGPSSLTIRLIIPLGISFFTFTNIAYLIDVKRSPVQTRHASSPYTPSLLLFANYVTFFPKLIQGPIERASHFMPQLVQTRHASSLQGFNYDQVVNGLRLMLWGFFKKLVIADRLAVAVTAVFDKPGDWNGPTLIFAAVLYSFQIYFDFSAYVDIARGAAKVLGFELLKNFNMPYLAKSIKEFWDRWHITLSMWLRDYLFLPVAFRVSAALKKEKYIGIKADQYIYAAAAIVTFTIAGLWHGTGWNFIIWGELFALYLIVANLTTKKKIKYYKKIGFYHTKWLYNPVQILITFSLVTFAWIFFRSNGFTNAMIYLKGIPYGWSDLLHGRNLLPQFTFNGFSYIDLALILMAIPFVGIVQYYFYSKEFLEKLTTGPKIPMLLLRWGFYYTLILIIFVFGKFESQSFIYFQF